MKKYLAIATVLIIISCSKEKDDFTLYEKSLPGTQITRLNFVLDSVCNSLDIKGVSSAIIIPGEGVWEGVYGFSHNQTPIRSDMALTIGSNTKTYIAALILKLHENGKLNINDKVSEYVKDIPYVNNTTTIKQLLNHTSGYGDFSYTDDFIYAIMDDFNKMWMPEETFPFFEAPVSNDESFYYSDQNYVIAGLVIKAATKKSVKANMRDLILNPAGLTKTVYYPFEQTALEIPHSWTADFGDSFRDIDEAEGYSRVAFCSADNAAGGMLGTAKENAIFWDKLMTSKIINQTSLNLMLETIPAPDDDSQYGLGIQKIVNRFNNTDFYSHNGYVPGSINDNAYDPVSGISIVVLTNQDLISDLNPILSVLHKEALKIKNQK